MSKYILSAIIAFVIMGTSLALAQDALVDSTPPVANHPSEDGHSWILIDGSDIHLYYLMGANLRKIEARLRSRYVPMSYMYKELLSDKSYPIESRISARLHIILERAETVLGMRPDIPRVDIKVFRTRSELADEVERIFHERHDYKSFYIHEYRGIYTSETDIIDSIIAHELAHVVIDHYFKVAPPSEVGEVLARYVDEHLDSD